MAVHEQAMEAVESGDPDTLIFVSDFGAAPMRVGEKTGTVGCWKRRSKPCAAPRMPPRPGMSGTQNG